MRLPAIYFAVLGALMYSWHGISGATCPCEVCPCYCPCTNRREVRIAFVRFHDYSSVQPDDSWSRNGLQIYYGVEQAARERGVQLGLYRHFNTDDARRLQRDVLDGSIHAIVATLYNELYVEPLLSAVSGNIPVYIVGSTTPQLLSTLRARAAALRVGSGYTSGHAALVNVGTLADEVTRQLAVRLLSLGIRRVDCIHSSETNLAFLQRCITLEREFQGEGLYAATHMQTRAFVPLALGLESLATDMAASTPGIPVSQTALVLMDAVMYNLVRDVKGVKRLLEGGHVAVFEPSPNALQDARDGHPVSIVDRPLYSEGYLATALASYEIQTGLALAADMPAAARVISGEEVSDADVAREACRDDGYPVCGDPGVPEISPHGCSCFNRSEVTLRLLATLPTRSQLHADVMAGLADARRDLPGTSFEWHPVIPEVYTSIAATASANASLSSNNWSALLSLDAFLAPLDPSLETAMKKLGASKGNRSYHLGLARGDEGDYDAGALLARYNADGYLGPSRAGWRSLGAFAREDPAGAVPAEGGADALLYLPLMYLPVWVEVAHQVVEGFFNGSVGFPAGFWGFPAQGAPENGTGVWSTFYDGWTPPPAPSASASARMGPQPRQNSTVGGDDDPLYSTPGKLDDPITGGGASYSSPTAVIRPAPPAYSSRGPFVEGLQTLLHDAGLAGAPYGTVAIAPVLADDVPLALEVMEEAGAAGYLAGTRLASACCFWPDYQAFAYPGSLAGGARHGACMDWQAQLVAYTTYMLSALRQHTRGERVLYGALPTERLATRDQPFKRKQRIADCLLYRADLDARQVQPATPFPVCDHAAGCGPNASHPCSGNGACYFPTAMDNAKSGSEGLPSSVGWCVCKLGYEGVFCERTRGLHRSELRLKALMAGVGVVGIAFLCLLAVVVYKWGRGLLGTHKRRRQLEARKKSPPEKDQPVAAVHAEIEGSAALWEWDATTWGQSLHVYQRVLRALLPKHHGYESHSQYDAFEAVFHDASDALHWALDAQLALMHPEDFPGATAKGGSLPPFPLSWPDKLLSHPLGEEVHDALNTTIYRGPRVRMGVHVGVPSGTTQLPSGHQRYLGPPVELAQAICGTSGEGGPVLLSMDAWAALDNTAPNADDLPILVFNMGEHLVAKDGPLTQIMLVLPQPLMHRAPFRPLRSHQQLSPSFFEAPGAHLYAGEAAPVDPVAIVFTFLGGGPRLKGRPEYAESVHLLSEFTRRILAGHNGYECEEKNGNFLLAFGDACDAALFTQKLQAGAMDLPWPEAILDHPAAAEVLLPTSNSLGLMMRDAGAGEASDTRDKFLFRGLRIKIGFYWGVPTRCLPHASTGRAAYFGPLMNRAARIAAIAASGQTLCNAEAVAALQAAIEARSPDVLFTSLGQAALKGVAAPVEIFQVSSAATSSRAFPRLNREIRANQPLPGSLVPGHDAAALDHSGQWAATAAGRQLHWHDTSEDKRAREARLGSMADSVDSFGESSTVSYSEHLARWEVELAAPATAWNLPTRSGPKAGRAQRPARGGMSMDSLVHALDDRLHALGNVAACVLPVYTGGAKARHASVAEVAGEEYRDSTVALAERNNLLCAISIPEADAGGEGDERSHRPPERGVLRHEEA